MKIWAVDGLQSHHELETSHVNPQLDGSRVGYVRWGSILTYDFETGIFHNLGNILALIYPIFSWIKLVQGQQSTRALAPVLPSALLCAISTLSDETHRLWLGGTLTLCVNMLAYKGVLK